MQENWESRIILVISKFRNKGPANMTSVPGPVVPKTVTDSQAGLRMTLDACFGITDHKHASAHTRCWLFGINM